MKSFFLNLKMVLIQMWQWCDAQRIKAGGYKKNDVCMSVNLIYSLYMHTLYMLRFDRQQLPINTYMSI